MDANNASRPHYHPRVEDDALVRGAGHFIADRKSWPDSIRSFSVNSQVRGSSSDGIDRTIALAERRRYRRSKSRETTETARLPQNKSEPETCSASRRARSSAESCVAPTTLLGGEDVDE